MSISLKKKIRKIIADEPGEHTDISGLKSDVSNLKTAVGKDDAAAGGLKKRCADIEADIGSSASGSESGIHKDIVDINTAIGDESTEGTILARIKALEDAQPEGES